MFLRLQISIFFSEKKNQYKKFSEMSLGDIIIISHLQKITKKRIKNLIKIKYLKKIILTVLPAFFGIPNETHITSTLILKQVRSTGTFAFLFVPNLITRLETSILFQLIVTLARAMFMFLL